MSAFDRYCFAKMLKKIGPWAGVRYLRNQGVAFADAHELILGRPPRR